MLNLIIGHCIEVCSIITDENRLKNKAKSVIQDAGLQDRAANSVELLAASF